MGMVIEYRSKLLLEFYANANKGRRWQVKAPPFEFSVDGEVFVLPDGFWTDFASVPRLFWNMISPYDLGVGPIPHDLGYFTGYRNKAYWDDVFYACTLKDNIDAWKREAAYKAVRWFAGVVWNGYRKSNTSRLLVPVAKDGKAKVINWTARPRLGAAPKAALSVKELLWMNGIEQLTKQAA